MSDPKFPGHYYIAPEELALRDKMAAACLPAIYASMTQLTDRAAELAYEQADEMMKARVVTPKCCGMRHEGACPCDDCPERSPLPQEQR